MRPLKGRDFKSCRKKGLGTTAQKGSYVKARHGSACRPAQRRSSPVGDGTARPAS